MSPSERMAALSPLRDWCERREDPKKAESIFANSLAKLAFGLESQSADFATTTEWLAKADLTATELALITRPDLFDMSYYIQPDQTGDWLEWMGENFPTEVSKARIGQFMTGYRTKKAAKEWLATAPDSPARQAVVRAYAASLHDPDAAEALLREHGVR